MSRRCAALGCALFCLAALPAAAAPPAVHPAPAAAASPATVPQYTLQDLGTLTPGGTAQPQGINQLGEVFGHASSSTTNLSLPNHLFFWSSSGGMIDIGALPDNRPPFSYPAEGSRAAVAINDHGQIIGESEVATSVPSQPFYSSVRHAFIWTPAADGKSGTMQDLGTLGAGTAADLGTTAVAVNNQAQVIGSANALTLTPQGYRDIDPAHGFLWTPGGTDGVPSNPQMKDLGLLQPYLLDNAGHVVGLLNGIVTLYDGRNFTAIGDPIGFDPNGLYNDYRIQFFRTDAQGDIYGNYSTPLLSINPFVWIPDYLGATTGHYLTGIHLDTTVVPPGTPTDAELPIDAQVFWSGENVFAFDPLQATLSAVDLGGLAFDTIREGNPYFPPLDAYILSRNTAGDLVGYSPSTNSSDLLAFLEHAGLMYDLNRHVQGANAGAYQLLQAVGINDNGSIAVLSHSTGSAYSIHAGVLIPAGQAAPAAPTIQLIQPQSPDVGDPDQSVDVQGTGFQVGAKLTYDGAPLAATVYAETQILATIPSADLTAGTHTVTVTNPDGRTASGTYVVLPVRPVPSLVSVSPTSLPAGSPDTAITFTGTGLYPETQVGYGYSPQNFAPLTVLSASADHTQITVRLPASLMTQGATLTFYASTPGQRGDPQYIPAPTLTVVNPVPTITSISPASLPADTISSFNLIVNGTNFVPGTRISWNGQYFSTNYVSPTQVTAAILSYGPGFPGPDTLPPGPVTVQVINAAPGGGTASTTQTIADGPYLAPTLTRVSPGVIAPGGYGYVFLTGSHFLYHSVVHIGSYVYPFATYGNYLSADRTQITLYLPPNVQPAVGVYPVTVVNPGPGGGTSAAQTLAVQAVSLRVSSAVLSRDQSTRQIIAQVTLADGPGADASGVTLTQASLGTASASSLPTAVGTVSASGTATVTLRFPAIFTLPNTFLILRVSGQYAGGTFTSSRRVSVPYY